MKGTRMHRRCCLLFFLLVAFGCVSSRRKEGGLGLEAIPAEVVSTIISHSALLGNKPPEPPDRLQVDPRTSSSWITTDHLLYLWLACTGRPTVKGGVPWFDEPWAKREEERWSKTAAFLRNSGYSIPVAVVGDRKLGPRTGREVSAKQRQTEAGLLVVLRISPPIPLWASPCGEEGLLAELEEFNGFSWEAFWVSLRQAGTKPEVTRVESVVFYGP